MRYSTTGSNAWENSQPVQRSVGTRGSQREVALAHNGNLINAVELHNELLAQGVTFSSTSDSEIIAALIATHPAERVEDAIAEVLPRLKGAFSTVVMTKDRVVAFRDPHGLRPLALGALGARGGAEKAQDDTVRYCVASESCALDIIGAKFLRDVQPGEVVTLERGGLLQQTGGGGCAQGVLCVRVHLLRAPGLAHERSGAAGGARAHGRDPVARGAGGGRRGDRGAGLGQSGGARSGARGGPAPGRRLREEPLRRAHVHPARAGAAQARVCG